MSAKRSRLRIRRLVAAALAAAAFCAYLIANPKSYQTQTSTTKTADDTQSVALKDIQTTADSLLARDVLDDLAVREKDTSEKYYRKLFYDSWSTTSSGCNMRDAILTRDLTEIVFDGCKVMSGKLNDPYTGQTINFTRGQDTSSAIQIDHVVALSNAWATGASKFDQTTRYNMSQDPLNLLAVDGKANQDKSDQDAADWLPPNTAFHCQYVARQISVKYKYHLWVTPKEKIAMQNVLTTCPTETTVGLENQ